MIAVAQPQVQGRYPYDTGCVFNGVRVRLECDDPQLAAALGNSLEAKGLYHETPSIMLNPRLVGKRVVLGRDLTGELVYCCWPTQAGQNIVVLETADPMMVEPFLKWLRTVVPNPNASKKEPKSLNDLADNGDIDVIDC